MKKALLVMIIALCFLSSAALAQEESRCGIVPEGYVCEEEMDLLLLIIPAISNHCSD